MENRRITTFIRAVQVFVFIIVPSVFSANGFYRIEYLSQTPQSIRVRVDFDSVNVIQKKVENTWYSKVVAQNCVYTRETGWPSLPFTALTLGIPPQGTPQLRVVQRQSESVPVTGMQLVQDLETDTFFKEQTQSYPLYPSMNADIEMSGFFREQRILQLKLYPVQYQPATNMLHITRSMVIEIDFTRGKQQPTDRIQSVSSNADPLVENYYSKMIDNPEAAKQWRSSLSAPAALAKTNSMHAPYQYKLSVEQDGIYAVTGQELIEAGADLNTIQVTTLSLYNRGAKVPMVVEGDGDGIFDVNDRIIFLGEHNKGDDTYYSLFSETNIYWLTWGSGTGARFAQIPGAPGQADIDTLNNGQVTIHLEKDLLYDRLVSMPDTDADHWLWRLMEEGLEYDVPIPGPGNSGAGPVRIKAAFQGLTHTYVSPDHHVLIKYNQQVVDDVIWDNQVPYLFDSGDLYISGGGETHSVSFNLPADLEGVLIDRIYLNWVEISYQQPLQAVNDSLAFSSGPDANGIYRISGFTSPELYLFTNTGARITDVKTVRNGEQYDFLFSDHVAVPKTIVAASANGLKSVTGIQSVSENNLKSLSNGADHIIITHQDFAEQAELLVNHRNSRGLRSMWVDIQDIFDEFSYGIYDPRAVKRFLQYAYYNWQKPAPLYILLLGDVTYKLDKQVARDEDLPRYIPTLMEYTQTWGMSSSDNFFASIVGDDELPDLFVGRLPVSTPEQAEIMISKTIVHETQYAPAEWRRHLLVLTGVDPYFESSALDLYRHHTPDHIITDRVATLDTSRYLGSTEDVAEFINSGQTILNFVGHGGGGVFSDAELFLLEDIERLSNANKYPFVFSLTCFIGHFDNPDSPSLAEELLAAKDKGIVGSFGSSGRAFLQGDYYLNNAIFDVVFKQNLRTYGAVATLGKIEMVNQTQGFWDHVKSYNLLGDPALPLYLPENNVNVELSAQTLLDNQDLVVTGSVTGQSTGNVQVTVYNDFDSLLTDKAVQMQNGAFTVNAINLNSAVRSAWGANGGQGRVRVYYDNGALDAAGAQDFSVGRPYVSALYTFPEQPRHNSPFFFVANVNRADITATLRQVDSLILRWSDDGEQWTPLGLVEQTVGYWRTTTSLTLAEGRDVYFEVRALSGQETVRISEIKQVQVAYRPDLYAESESMQVYGEQQTLVNVEIGNHGIEASGPFTVNLYIEDNNGILSALGDTVTISGLGGKSETRATFIWESPTPGRHQLVCIVDEGNIVAESEERNNRITRSVAVATKSAGTNGELYDETRRHYVLIQPNVLNKNSSIDFSRNSSAELSDALETLQLGHVMPIGDTTWSALSIDFADSTVQLQEGFTVAAFYDPQDSLTAYYMSLGSLRLYAWNTVAGVWTGLESQVNTQEHIIHAIAGPDYRDFALLASDDTDAPSIQIGVEGQNFADGDIVPKKPVFTVLMTDSSGFDSGPGPVTLTLDNQSVNIDDVILYRNKEQKRQLTASFIPELTSGSHILAVEASDINGNSNRVEVGFEIAAEFTLQSIANHPNPFVDETVIAFTLADVAEEVTLDIYTVSGRLIRSFEFTDISGYIEQDWDGLDDEGREVANGVYYLRFKARQGDKSIEQIEKMARLK